MAAGNEPTAGVLAIRAGHNTATLDEALWLPPHEGLASPPSPSPGDKQQSKQSRAQERCEHKHEPPCIVHSHPLWPQ